MKKRNSLYNRLFLRLILVCVAALVVCISAITPILAAQEEEPITGVIDDGDLLTDEEEEQLTQYIEDISAKHGVHVLALTVSHKKGYSNNDIGSISYASSFYDKYVEDSSIDSPGFMVMLDMENHFLYIHTSNNVIDWVSAEDCDDILDDTYDLAGADKYYDALYQTIRGVDDKIDNYFFKVFMGKLGITAGGAIIPALIVSFVLAYHKRSKVTTTYSTYIDEPKTKIEYNADDFTHQTVSVIHHSSGSGSSGRGGGGGGGGRRSGGSGRHF